jgi:hypothetical protein
MRAVRRTNARHDEASSVEDSADRHQPRSRLVTDRVKPIWQGSYILGAAALAGSAWVTPAWTLFGTEIQEASTVSHLRVRFTVRRLMLVVLIFAALPSAFEAGRRWERAKRAAPHDAVHQPVKGSLEFR